MKLTRYEPFEMLNQLQKEMSRLFPVQGQTVDGTTGMLASDWAPDVDIREEKDRFVLQADLPGVDPKDIDITLENGVLTIKGQRATEKVEQGKGYQYVERVQGGFMRRFTLPNTADAAKVSAKTKDGVLEVVVPKEDKAEPRRIAIET